MISLKSLFAASMIAGSMLLIQPVQAMIVGQAVNEISGTSSTVGNLATRSLLGPGTNNAIEYFIPLGNSSGTYGVTNGGIFGTQSDTGNGGGTLTMFLRFDGLTVNNGNLSILFEDLDLAGVNDPFGFFETVQLFDQGGSALTQNIVNSTDTGAFVINTAGGPNDTLELAILNLGPVAVPTFFLQLDFTARFKKKGRNTAEYLRATFTEGTGTIGEVPLPAAFPLFGTGLAVMGFIGWRRKRAAAA